MENIITLIAQASATLTTLMGIAALVLIFIASSKLAKDEFRSMILSTFWLVLIALVGVTSMTIYHFVEDLGNYSLAELTENIWYAFMMISLVFSCYVSQRIASFGKRFRIAPLGRGPAKTGKKK
ncbi:MAG TPA: hypothetical protein HA362_02835 [Nanoarchaeota archaeon]|nr:hypothetical protein [Nanoarchaeota archaeon]